jgi:hypothetical protein
MSHWRTEYLSRIKALRSDSLIPFLRISEKQG